MQASSSESALDIINKTESADKHVEAFKTGRKHILNYVYELLKPISYTFKHVIMFHTKSKH